MTKERMHMCKWHGPEKCIGNLCPKSLPIGKAGTHYCRIPSLHQFHSFESKTFLPADLEIGV